jgi:hypothetical protein
VACPIDPRRERVEPSGWSCFGSTSKRQHSGKRGSQSPHRSGRDDGGRTG